MEKVDVGQAEERVLVLADRYQAAPISDERADEAKDANDQIDTAENERDRLHSRAVAHNRPP